MTEKNIQDNILKKNIKKITYQIDLGQLELTFQICDPCHETMITLNNQNKYEAQLPIKCS